MSILVGSFLPQSCTSLHLLCIQLGCSDDTVSNDSDSDIKSLSYEDTKKSASGIKRSLSEITMFLTEATEAIFLFGSGSYHERASKKNRILECDEVETSSKEHEVGSSDFRLNTGSLWHMVHKKKSLLDREESIEE
jgi:hypothetical protein